MKSMVNATESALPFVQTASGGSRERGVELLLDDQGNFHNLPLLPGIGPIHTVPEQPLYLGPQFLGMATAKCCGRDEFTLFRKWLPGRIDFPGDGPLPPFVEHRFRNVDSSKVLDILTNEDHGICFAWQASSTGIDSPKGLCVTGMVPFGKSVINFTIFPFSSGGDTLSLHAAVNDWFDRFFLLNL